MEQQGIYERIKERVGQLKEESQDRYFTEYLVKLESGLIQEKHQLDLIEAGLERNLRIYRQRMETAQSADEPQASASGLSLTQPEKSGSVGAFSAGTVEQSSLHLRQGAPQAQETPQPLSLIHI